MAKDPLLVPLLPIALNPPRQKITVPLRLPLVPVTVVVLPEWLIDPQLVPEHPPIGAA
jgi:hypothetical protein